MGRKPEPVRNPGGVYDPEKIVRELVSFWGLFDRILGKHMRPLVYDTNVDNSIQLLEQAYWLRNAGKVLPGRLLRSEFDRVSETVFRVVRNSE